MKKYNNGVISDALFPATCIGLLDTEDNYDNNNLEVVLSTLGKLKNQLSSPNLLINGGFNINQRGLAEYTASGNAPYTLDRWRCYTLPSSGSSDVEVATVTRLSKGIKVRGVSGGTNNSPRGRLRQIFSEGDTTYLRGKTLVFSLKVIEDCSEVTMSALHITNTVFTTKEYTNIKAGSVLTLPLTVPADAVNLAVQFSTSDTLGIQIEWAKLEVGSLPTPYIPVEAGLELLRCQRYYEASDEGAPFRRVCNTTTSDTTALYLNAFEYFKVTKRVRPTVTYYYDISDTSYPLSSTTTFPFLHGFCPNIVIPASKFLDMNRWEADAEIY